MDIIYDTMKKNNFDKINTNGLNYDTKLKCEYDDRYCIALFTIPTNNNTFLTKEFYTLQDKLSNENVGITYFVENNNTNMGTFHFTFMQQITFNSYYDVPMDIIDKYYDIMNKIIKKHLPIKIFYNKLILVTNGLVICGIADIDINMVRDEYRNECKNHNLPLIEPYYLNIIHSTLFRFTDECNHIVFREKYKYYLDNDVDYGYIVIDHVNIGKATWKVNSNEIDIMKIVK